MLKIVSVVGTRPNFIKIAPLIEEMNNHKGIKNVLVHTGQHYDASMSKRFFDDLGMPKPDINLGIGSDSDAMQTAKIMLALEGVLSEEKPDLVVVVGDVNSTLAAALTAKKCRIRVAHVESGLRSFDPEMPEELNRILTDHISDFLFTTERSANTNLLKEGASKNKIFFVWNVMIDTLIKNSEKARSSHILKRLGIKKKNYAVLTLHRPSNVDSNGALLNIFEILKEVQKKIKIIFPVHPRTVKNIKRFKLDSNLKSMKNLIITEPLGYIDFLSLMDSSAFVMTDSGGVQEETTILKVPCVTLRNNTERPVTVEQGTNMAVSTKKDDIAKACLKIVNGSKITTKTPELWDGRASKRIVDILIKKSAKSQK